MNMSTTLLSKLDKVSHVICYIFNTKIKYHESIVLGEPLPVVMCQGLNYDFLITYKSLYKYYYVKNI